MSAEPGPESFEVVSGEVTLAGEAGGEGPPIVLLHGLTATRRYVVMGSRLLERSGYRLISYDARGHGASAPASASSAYEYADMRADLEAVLDAHAIDRAVLAGSSMGAATALSFALEHPERVAALVQSTPAYAGDARVDAASLATWDALADGLERDGVDGFLAAYHPTVEGRWRDALLRLTRQRLERHSNPGALADALRVVPRSVPFEGLERLAGLEVPTLIVASRDDADPEHPLAVAETYAERVPNAELVVEEPGKSPLAWRGAQVSRAIADFLARRVPGYSRRD